MSLTSINDAALDQVFRNARSQNKWKSDPLPDGILEEVYELAKWGPTSANCSPARFTFITSEAAKERLRPALAPQNVDKCMTVPAVVLIGQDNKFYGRLPELMPHNPAMKDMFENNAPMAAGTAFRNSSLQGAYFMLAARALGLDCGPLSGFNPDAVNAEFFAGTDVTVNFICGIGVGEPEGVFPRSPRLEYKDACETI